MVQPSLDQVTTINEDGSRNFIYPADVRGRFTNLRKWVALALILFYASLPWIQVNGNPAVFLDTTHNQFHLIGLTLVGQDLWLGFFVVTGMGFSLFFLTSLLGRLWCGWACPQTVFIEQVYRRIERWIEGPALERRQLESSSWSSDKIIKRFFKHLIYLVLSVAIAHLFLSYFVSLPELYRMMKTSPGANLGLFLFVFLLSGLLYFNFAWFREQFCIVLCPYGRLQSALIDDHSVVIGYDKIRGEPRGKATTSGVGSCVDCHRCVQVCPTGIDIRQGLQMECISCSNCIDACDEVMVKLERPKGLIRYDSMKGLSGDRTRWIRPRTILYSGLLLLGTAVMVFALSTFRPLSVSALRMVGAPYYLTEESVRNQYLMKFLNKENRPLKCRVMVEAEGKPVILTGVEDEIEIPALGEQMRPLVVTLARSEFHESFPLKVTITSPDHSFVISKSLPFLGPEAAH